MFNIYDVNIVHINITFFVIKPNKVTFFLFPLVCVFWNRCTSSPIVSDDVGSQLIVIPMVLLRRKAEPAKKREARRSSNRESMMQKAEVKKRKTYKAEYSKRRQTTGMYQFSIKFTTKDY